jgi:hypothetical protein
MSMKITVTTKRSGPSLADSASDTIECPECGHKMKVLIAKLQNDPTLVCPRGHRFKVKTGGTARKVTNELKEIDRLMDNLFKR